MYEFRDPLILGLSNVVIGTTSKIFYIETLRSVDLFSYNVSSNCGYIIGALVSEYYCKKFGKQGLLFIYLGFLMSGTLMFPFNVYSGNASEQIALIGIGLNNFCQSLLLIFQVKCIKPIIKQSEKKYCIAVLFSLNQLGFVLFIFLKPLEYWQNSLIFLAGILYSILISTRFRYKKSSFISRGKRIKTILPFSAFTVESFGFGMAIFAYRISNKKAASDFEISMASFGYIFGTFLVTYLISFRNRLIIFGMLVIIPFIVLSCFEIDQRNIIYELNFISLILVNIVTGMLEVLNIYLIVVNSNRPEFFIGMLYFIAYLCEIVAYFYVTNLKVPDIALLCAFFTLSVLSGFIINKELSRN